MLFVLTLSTTYYYKYFLLITRVHIKGNNVLWPSWLLDFSDAHPQTMPTTRARVIQPLFLPRGAQIEIEYNPRWPSIRTIVRQVEALGYWVSVESFWGQRDIINGGFTSQRVGTHVLFIYPPPFDPRRNKEEIAMERLQQVHIESVQVEVAEDLLDRDPLAAPHTSRRHTPYPIFEDPSSEFYVLTTIQYQGEIILWLQREYGLHVQVNTIRRLSGGTEPMPKHKTSILNTRLVSLIYSY